MVPENPDQLVLLLRIPGSTTLLSGVGNYLRTFHDEGTGACGNTRGGGSSAQGMEVVDNARTARLSNALATIYAGESSLGALDAVVQRLTP